MKVFHMTLVHMKHNSDLQQMYMDESGYDKPQYGGAAAAGQAAGASI